MINGVQLTLEDILSVQSIKKCTAEEGPRVFDQYLMLDKLESFKGKTAQFEYQDNYLTASFPALFEKLWFGSYTGKNSEFPMFYKMGSEQSYIQVTEPVHKLIEENGLYTFIYNKKLHGVGKEKSRVINDVRGKMSFRLKPYLVNAAKFPNLDDDGPEEIRTKLIGSRVRIGIRPYEDWAYSAVSIPFDVIELWWEEDLLTIVGSNDVSISVRGFKKVRSFKTYAIFDVFNDVGGYSRSITIMGNNKNI